MLYFPFYDKDYVRDEWIDRNGHMNDAEYARVFSLAIDHFHDQVGLTNEERDQREYTVFTLETHITYIKEMKQGTPFKIEVSIYDMDEKRTHFFLTLINEHNNEVSATAETMMMGMDRQLRQPAPFPDDVYAHIQTYVESQGDVTFPKQLGHRIGIPKQ
ncbi:thioesterase family protein [Staphylococcus ratti]|uniref:Thioesterase family protein n=1 Tax=Staphylococcus ratti TaxID=2892440 RepID=A0ABY3PDX5_9STAP|nr:thioesterase family protein [Staphylococcus ratti]UEX90490.1 thioesterase family protein [Staphylococcus ratti]